jgi:hypothetical protein
VFWKKKKTPDEQVKADVNAIVASLEPKWKYFCEAVPFRADVPLHDRIDAFAAPAIAGILQNYPSTKHAPPQMLWLMIFTAIQESRTHPMTEVNAAVAELQKKYARD